MSRYWSGVYLPLLISLSPSQANKFLLIILFGLFEDPPFYFQETTIAENQHKNPETKETTPFLLPRLSGLGSKAEFLVYLYHHLKFSLTPCLK